MVTVLAERFIEIETDNRTIVIDMSRIVCFKKYKQVYNSNTVSYTLRILFDNAKMEEFGFVHDIPSMVLDLYENYLVNQKHNVSL